ncbi:unnamed protein product [marine sediment metagenome]|uniref:Uncharacterized protein n=1 Tax=marine sediment metagenome TaxID=412755 RepID=X0YG07_9ZZZZ
MALDEEEIQNIKDSIEEMKTLIEEHGWGSVFLYAQKKPELFPVFVIAYAELVNEGYLPL